MRFVSVLCGCEGIYTRGIESVRGILKTDRHLLKRQVLF